MCFTHLIYKVYIFVKIRDMHPILNKFKPYNKVVLFLHKTTITKHKLSLRLILKDFFKEIIHDDIQSKAQSMAFNFILAIFPAIIFLFTLIPYLPIGDYTAEILSFMSQSMPTNMYEMMSSTILDILKKPRGGLLSFGFLLSIFAAMNGTLSMMNAFNHCYKNTVEKRGFLKTRLVALGLTLLLVVSLLVAIVVLNIGEFLINYLKDLEYIKSYIIYLINAFRYIILVTMFFFATSMIYFLAPSVRIRWSFFSHGAVIATVLNVITSVSFTIYINNFSSYNKLYGSIGTLIGMMLWFYITSLVLLIGFEFNASIDAVKTIKNKIGK